MANELRIADDLALPADAVTETFLIFGKRGVGKTSTGTVLAEELIGAGQPVCVLDPKGDWWGLRSSADGQGPGLPVLILGGDHADLPLDPRSGAAVADLVAAERLPVVIDMSLMSKTQQRSFVTDFMERLYRVNREPLHLIIDEADRFAPQNVGRDMTRLLGAYEDIVLRGRKFGIGSTSITLRPAQLNSAIRSQVEVLIAMRLLGKLDVDAINEWIRVQASEEDARDLKDTLPKMPVGVAWIWSPGWLEILQKVQVRPRRTFDSSATPKVGEQLVRPRQFARLDEVGLERMAALLVGDGADVAPASPGARKSAAQGAEEARLREQVRTLTLALEEARSRPAERVEVPVLSPGDIAELRQAVGVLRDVTVRMDLALSRGAVAATPAPARAPAPQRAAAALPTPAPEPAGAKTVQARPLKAGARNMLEQLARHHPLKMTRNQLAALSGIKGSGSTFSSYFSALRINGFVTQEDTFVLITPEGLAAAGTDAGAAPPTPDEIRARWRSVLKAGARAMLDLLLERYPEPIPRAELGELAGINPVGSTLSSYLSSLRSNNLITEDSAGIRAADVFFLQEVHDLA